MGFSEQSYKSDRFQWLQSIYKNLIFWKYVSSFTKNENNSIELEVDGNPVSAF
jgi:hypothetical protein